MTNMIIKTTLLRSNPRIIRQFAVDGNRTVKELSRIIAVVHGWKGNPALKLYNKDGIIGEKTQIKDIVDGRCELVLGMPMEGEHRNPDINPLMKVDTGWWRFFVELVSKDEEISVSDGKENNKKGRAKAAKKAQEPELVRSYGLHPAEKCRSMSDCNSVQEYMEGGGGYYPYYLGRLNVTEHKVNMAKINRKLKQELMSASTGEKKIAIRHDYGRSLKMILAEQRVDGLKFIIQRHHFPISVNQRKQNLINDLTDYIDQPDFWQYMLGYMRLDEYQIFKNIVTGKTDILSVTKYALSTLAMLGLLGEESYSISCMPKELLEYYEDLLLNTGDEEYLKEKRAREVLIFCGRLYGVFSRDVYEQVCRSAYPEEPDVTVYWDMVYSAVGREVSGEWKIVNTHIIYNESVIKTENAQEMVQSERFRKGIFYIPDKESFDQIRTCGLNYSRDGQKKIREKISFLSRFLNYDTEYDFVCRRIYEYYQKELQGDLKAYIAASLDRRIMASAREIDHLKAAADCLKAEEIRLIRLGGYTQKELEKLIQRG